MATAIDNVKAVVTRLAEDYGLSLDPVGGDVAVYGSGHSDVIDVFVKPLCRTIAVTADTNLSELGSLFHSVRCHKRSLAKLGDAADRVDANKAEHADTGL